MKGSDILLICKKQTTAEQQAPPPIPKFFNEAWPDDKWQATFWTKRK